MPSVCLPQENDFFDYIVMVKYAHKQERMEYFFLCWKTCISNHSKYWICNCYLNVGKWLLLIKMPNQQFFSHTMARTSYISMRWYLLCTKPTLNWIFILLSHWNQIPQVNILIILDTLSDSEPTNSSYFARSFPIIIIASIFLI